MTLRKIDKDMIDPSFKQEIDTEISNQINVLKEEVAADYSTKTEFTNHDNKIASTTELGHIKPDGTTITVDPATGIASATSSGNGRAVPYAGHLDVLITPGLYSIPAGTPGSVSTVQGAIVEVTNSDDGSFIIQRYRSVLNHLVEGFYFRTGTKNENGGIQWAISNPGQGAILNGWRLETMTLSDAIDVSDSNKAATANAVKQVNDKIEKTNQYLGTFAPFENTLITTLRYKNIGGFVGVNGVVRVTATGATNTICRLPSEFSPSTDVPFTIRRQRDNAYTNIKGLIDNGGAVLVDSSDVSGLAINDYLHINFVFVTKL